MTFSNPSVRSDFMGNPIVIDVVERALVSSRPISFHQVHLRVKVSQDGVFIDDYPLSQPFSGTTEQTLSFDISSCFRAVSDRYEYQPLTSAIDRIYPVYTASIEAYSSYMQDGARIETTHISYPSTIVTHLGRYSDYERRQSVSNATLTATLTRKPSSSPELVFPGDTILYATPVSGSSPAGLTTPVPEASPSGSSPVPEASPSGSIPSTSVHQVPTGITGTSITLAGHQYYVSPRRRGSVLFQFVNSRGCIESIRAFALPAEKGNAADTDHTISRFERFDRFSRTLKRKQLRPTEFSLSSGIVDYAWARWWYYEFCQSEHVWMLVDKHNSLAHVPASSDGSVLWLPVNIQPSDSTTIIDPTKPNLLHVDFSVIPDINGPLF